MSDEAALRKAIVAEPDEDTPRLAYADWLDENRPDRLPSPAAGSSARAEFIRVQCRLAAGAFDAPDYPELLEREQDLAAWLSIHDPDRCTGSSALTIPEQLETGEWGDWRRGFVEMLSFDEYEDSAEVTIEQLAAALHTAFLRTPARTLRLEDATTEEVTLLVRQPVFGQLRGLYLDYFSDGDEDHAVAALARSRWAARLRRLYFDFPIGLSELTALAGSRYLNALESLTIDYPAVGFREIKALGRAKWLRNLRRLHLWIENGEALEAVADLPVLPRLVSLTLRISVLTAPGSIRQFTASRSFPNLARLNLSGCHLPADKLAMLADGRWPLRHLTLDHNEVRRFGAEALVEARFAPTLRVLELRECEITASGVQALAAAESLAGLRHLDLSDNPIGASGLSAIAECATLRELRALGLRRINTPRGPIAARDVCRFLTTLNMPGLRHLQLCGLPVGVRGARALATRPTFARLTRLGLERCRLGQAAVEALIRSEVLANLAVLELGWNRAGAAALKLTRRKVLPRLATCSLVYNRLPWATRVRLCRRPGILV